MLSLIVAMAHGRVIGSKNDLPWYLPSDLKRFKELTTGHSVIMGHKTFESIVTRLGKPLPNRQNIVMTRHADLLADGAVMVDNIDAALNVATSDEVFVIGGAQIYELALPKVDRMYVTEVDAEIKGDTLFPEYRSEDWRETAREAHQADEKNQFPYSFVTLERV